MLAEPAQIASFHPARPQVPTPGNATLAAAAAKFAPTKKGLLAPANIEKNTPATKPQHVKDKTMANAAGPTHQH
jgi:hypothetical protein